MTIRIAINGYGRIGRQALRSIYEYNLRNDFEIVAVNASGDLATNAHLTKFDTVHGRFAAEVSHDDNTLIVNGDRIPFFSTRNPAELPWDTLQVDLVLECTGAFTSKEKCQAHINAGAKKVLISAPGGDDVDATIVYGVNHDVLTADMTVVSNASCTTNCLAPVAKVLNDKWGIKRGLMTTVHAATASQKTVDGTSRKDWRGGRGILENIIPSSTGAAKAVGKVIPELNKKLTGMSFRVPTSDVSVVDLTVELANDASYDEICAEMKAMSERPVSEGGLQGVLGYTTDKVVSTDFRGENCVSVFDATAGLALDKSFVKIVAWYDNEWGYAAKCLEMVRVVAR